MLYILINAMTKQVVGICEKDTAQVEEGMEKIVLDGNINDLEIYGFNNQEAFHKFENGRFIVDADRKNETKQKVDKKNADKQSAINKLTGLGLTQDEIDTL